MGNEWNYDSNGKYRYVGNTKVYAAKIQTTHGTFYEDELEEANRRDKEDTERIYREMREKAAREPKTYCPIMMGRGGMNVICKRDCVLYGESGCIITGKAEKDTQGSLCVIAGRQCFKNCTWYKGGCVLAGFVKGLTAGKE